MSGKGRPRLLQATLSCVLVLLVITAGAGGSAAGRTPSLTTVKIAVLPLEPTALGFYAKHRGFFRKQGIDPQIAVFADPTQIAAAVLSGEAHFSSFSTGGLAILKSRGAPVRLVAAGALYRPEAPTAALVAGPGKTITRARDLIGKRIAIDATNTIAHIALLKWLKRNGVSADDVRLSEIPFAQMLGPLRRGTVDAAVLPEPFLTLAIQRGARRVANTSDAVCPQDCLLTVWMGRRDADPELAARFRNAIQAAGVWANQKKNDRASGAILARYAPIDAAVIEKMARTRFSERLRPALAQPWIDVFAEFGVIPASFSAIDLVK
ncbi:MAG: ABC transporter substrate-binding protein [Actinobacteria bacterium]|nr:ABC transporter substrate-binding protein [Actinomycetota bacterium]